MISFLLYVVIYLVIAGATHGYGKHRWPKKIRKVRVGSWDEHEQDDNVVSRVCATIFWPFYWTFIWTFTKTNELTFSFVERRAAKHIAGNKIRIADLQATRAELEKSNAELEQAEVELEKEIAEMS